MVEIIPKGKDHWNWKGGRSSNNGYIYIYDPTIREMATIYLCYPTLSHKELKEKIPEVNDGTIKSIAYKFGLRKNV